VTVECISDRLYKQPLSSSTNPNCLKYHQIIHDLHSNWGAY